MSKCFNDVLVTTVTCIANSDVELEPLSNNGGYILVNARPLTTWDTLPFIYYKDSSHSHWLRAVGLTTQEYEIIWMVTI